MVVGRRPPAAPVGSIDATGNPAAIQQRSIQDRRVRLDAEQTTETGRDFLGEAMRHGWRRGGHGGIGNRPLPDNKLRDPAVRQQFLDESRKLGVEICSIALSGFYGQSWSKNSNGDAITEDWIETMRGMGAKAGFLPLLGAGDIAKDEENRKLAIERFKRVAPNAEQAGVVMGIETMLDVEQSKRFLDEVGSPAVRLYYNLGLGIERGGDIYQEIRQLGKDLICMIHAKEEDGHWLGDPAGTSIYQS
jgi:sugar phosphate isomerase/epimerase